MSNHLSLANLTPDYLFIANFDRSWRDGRIAGVSFKLPDGHALSVYEGDSRLNEIPSVKGALEEFIAKHADLQA